MITLNEEILRLEHAKFSMKNSLIFRDVDVPESATLDVYPDLINSIKGGTSSEEVTATRANVLSGTTTITSDSNDEIVEGTMIDNGSVNYTLNAGESYSVPEGYHNGSGIITANSLASQTVGTATSDKILSGDTAWVNGAKITGTMKNNGAVSASVTPTKSTTSYTIPEGYHNGSGKVTINGYGTKYTVKTISINKTYSNNAIIASNIPVNAMVYFYGSGTGNSTYPYLTFDLQPNYLSYSRGYGYQSDPKASTVLTVTSNPVTVIRDGTNIKIVNGATLNGTLTYFVIE